MTERPKAVVEPLRVPSFDRPPEDGVGWRVRPLGRAGGLTRMGVNLREIDPGLAGTHLHFHDAEEEWAFVLSGRGRVRIGPVDRPVRAGHFVGFPPGPRPHHFVAEGDAPLVLVEGGERRPAEDVRTYPTLGVRNCGGDDEPVAPGGLPTFEGDDRQITHVDDVAERERRHPLDPAVVRHQRNLDTAVGLTRQACSWVRVEAGGDSTVFHMHEGTDEWVYLLSGEAELRLGDVRCTVVGGEFLAYPAHGPAHVMTARTDVVYLMGGEARADDVVIYPDLRKRLTSAGFEDLAP